MDDSNDGFPDLDFLLDQAEQEIEIRSKRAAQKHIEDNNFDPLENGSSSSVTPEVSNVCLLENFYDKLENKLSEVNNDTSNEDCPSPPEERGKENESVDVRHHVRSCSEERIETEEETSGIVRQEIESFEHTEAENTETVVSSENRIDTNGTQSNDQQNLVFAEPEMSEAQCEQYLRQIESLRLEPEFGQSDQELRGEVVVPEDVQSVHASFIDDSPIENHVTCKDDLDANRKQLSEEMSTIVDDNDANTFTSASQPIAGSEGCLGMKPQETESVPEIEASNDQGIEQGSRMKSNRPLVEYFGGDSPEGSFSSEDMQLPGLLSNSFGNDASIRQLGTVEPRWVEDRHRMMCSYCETRFTLVNRRHHCRACGEVFCARCSDSKRVLAFNPSLGPQRVCKSCKDLLVIHVPQPTPQPPPYSTLAVSHRNPADYCSRAQPPGECIMPTDPTARPNNWVVYIPPDLINENQIRQEAEVSVPIMKSALKTRHSESGTEAVVCDAAPATSDSKMRVTFADGVVPGSPSIEDPPTSKYDIIRKNVSRGRAITRQMHLMDQLREITANGNRENNNELEIVEVKPGAVVKRKIRESSIGNVYESCETLGDNKLPPVIGELEEELLKLERENPEIKRNDVILQRCREPEKPPVVFKLETNLQVDVKICNLSCCLNGECFVFVSRGLEHHCQTEIVLVIRRESPEEPIPRTVFHLFSHIYRMALLGVTVKHLDCITTETLTAFLDRPDSISGVLFFSPTYQCEKNLPLSPDKESRSPLLFGLLLHRWEYSWAQVYPLRVLLRIGHAYKQYPCPLVSVRDRSPLYADASGSILDQFVDVQNFKFNDFKFLPDTFANIIASEKNSASFLVPRNRYDAVNEVLSAKEVEDEFIFGLSFSTFADSHLVCIEKDDGKFEPQAFCQNSDGTRKCTGVGFLLFSGTLHPDVEDSIDEADSEKHVTARITIVEDGLMILMCRSLFRELKQSLYAMRDFQIPCQTLQDYHKGVEAVQNLSVRWIEDYEVHSPSEISPIDGSDLETNVSCNVFNAFDYVCRPAESARNLVSLNSTPAGEENSSEGDGTKQSTSSGEQQSSGILRWTRIFYLTEEPPSEPLVDEPNDTHRLPQKLAKAFCLAMSAHLTELREMQCFKLGLRVHITVDHTEYKAGANGTLFSGPSPISDSMDTYLVPLVFEEAARVQSTAPIAIELHFHLLDI